MVVAIVVSVPVLFSTKDVANKSCICEIFLDFFLFLFLLMIFSHFLLIISLQRFHTSNWTS